MDLFMPLGAGLKISFHFLFRKVSSGGAKLAWNWHKSWGRGQESENNESMSDLSLF
jgi:hypothetical protein